MVGIWQTDAYFKDINDIIFREFEFRIPTDKINGELLPEFGVGKVVREYCRIVDGILKFKI